jgi:hypothetical protein
MAFAGLWEGFRWPDGNVTPSFTIITTDASADVAELHERMPVILEPDDWPVWLGETPAILHPCCTRRHRVRYAFGRWIGGSTTRRITGRSCWRRSAWLSKPCPCRVLSMHFELSVRGPELAVSSPSAFRQRTDQAV